MKTHNDDWVEVGKEKEQENFSEKGTFDVDGEKYTPYAMSSTYKLPIWLKACFTKWWFSGAIFYFVFFGLGNVLDSLIMALVLGLVWGALTDVAVNHYFRDFSSPGHDYTKYIIFGKKQSFISIIVNLLIGVVFSLISAITIEFVIDCIVKAKPSINPDDLMLYFGAVSFAFLMLSIDLIVVFIKQLVIKIILKNKKSIENNSAVVDSAENPNDNTDITKN